MPLEISHEIVISGLVIILFLGISALFSAAETALTALSRARLYQLVKEGNKRAQVVSRLRREKESMIGTILLGNNAVNIAASALATSLSMQLFGNGESEALLTATLVMTVLVVVFAEILPKTYAIQNAERVSLALAPLMLLIVRIFKPVSLAIQVIIRITLRLFRVDMTQGNNLVSSTDVIRGTIELHHREGQVVKQDRDMLGSILDLNDIEVGEIMVHRTQVDMLDINLPVQEIVQQAVSMLHSRIPLWRDNPDNVVGILHVKDLIHRLNELDRPLTNEAVLEIAHEPWFIPETTTLRDQLLAFRARKQHFALVIDEYGALLGIVTLEDIIEEIVGNIDDEHDEHSAALIEKQPDGSFIVAGDVTIRDLNRELDWELPDEHASTIAGLVVYEAAMLPPRGARFEMFGMRVTVIDRKATHIKRLKLQKTEDITEDNTPS